MTSGAGLDESILNIGNKYYEQKRTWTEYIRAVILQRELLLMAEIWLTTWDV